MKLRRTELNKKFSALSFLFAMEMVIDIFSVLRTMTADSMSKIRLDQVIPANYLQENGDYLFGTCTKIYSISGKINATARLPMTFGIKKGNMVSPFLKLLPLSYLRLQWNKPNRTQHQRAMFCFTQSSVEMMYLQDFWEDRKMPKKGKKAPISIVPPGQHWSRNVPVDLSPSRWWERITTSDIVVKNAGGDLVKAYQKLGAAFRDDFEIYPNFENNYFRIKEVIAEAILKEAA